MYIYICIYICMGSFWGHFVFILGSFWQHSGAILAFGLPPLPENGSSSFYFILIVEWEIVIVKKIKINKK